MIEGYKGHTFEERSGVVYAPYIPLITTGPLANPEEFCCIIEARELVDEEEYAFYNNGVIRRYSVTIDINNFTSPDIKVWVRPRSREHITLHDYDS